MKTHHTRNEDLKLHEQTANDDPAREMTRGPMVAGPYDLGQPAGALEDVVRETGSSDLQRRMPYNLRSSGTHLNGPVQQPNFDYRGQKPAQPAFGPSAFEHTLEQPFAPQQTQFPGDQIGQDQFGSFSPMWNSFFNMNPAANTLPFMPPPFFFPSPVSQGPGGVFDGLPPSPFDPSAMCGFDGNLQNGPPGPKAGPRSRPRSGSPEAPKPTEQYLTQASLPPKQLPAPQPLLVILDLNGTLICRKSRKYPPVFTKRPGLAPFLKTLLKQYKVMIWSSSQPHTVKAVCEMLFPKEKRGELVGEWARNTLGLSKSQYSAKTQVYKKLDTVWVNPAVQATYPGVAKRSSGGKKKKKKQQQQESMAPAGLRWDQTNTILIDDSKLKAVSEPWNIIEIPEFTNAPDVDESHIFPDVLNRLNVLARYDDVSKVLRQSSEDPGSFPTLPDEIDTSIQPDAHPEQQPQPKPLTKKEMTRAGKGRTDQRELARQQARENKVHAKVAAKRKKGKKRRVAREKAAGAGADPTAPAPVASAEAATQEQPGQPQPSTRSSPSSASSQSENFLLDRLEESLNVQRD